MESELNDTYLYKVCVVTPMVTKIIDVSTKVEEYDYGSVHKVALHHCPYNWHYLCSDSCRLCELDKHSYKPYI